MENVEMLQRSFEKLSACEAGKDYSRVSPWQMVRRIGGIRRI